MFYFKAGKLIQTFFKKNFLNYFLNNKKIFFYFG